MAIGTIIAQVFTSRGSIPISDATVSVLIEHLGRMELTGFRTTDRNGQTSPVSIETPDRELSENPNSPLPFAACSLRIDHPLYYTIVINDVQVFADTTSMQNAELIPLEENSDPSQRVLTYTVTPQNL